MGTNRNCHQRAWEPHRTSNSIKEQWSRANTVRYCFIFHFNFFSVKIAEKDRYIRWRAHTHSRPHLSPAQMDCVSSKIILTSKSPYYISLNSVLHGCSTDPKSEKKLFSCCREKKKKCLGGGNKTINQCNIYVSFAFLHSFLQLPCGQQCMTKVTSAWLSSL